MVKFEELSVLCDEWWEVTHKDNINGLTCILTGHDDFRRAIR